MASCRKSEPSRCLPTMHPRTSHDCIAVAVQQGWTLAVVLVSVFAFQLRDFDNQYCEGDRRHHGSMNTINMDCRLFYFISVCVVTQYMHRFSAVHALFGHHGHLIGGNLLRNFSREVSKLFFSMHVHSVFLMWPPQSLQKGKSSKPSTICFSELDSVVEFVQLEHRRPTLKTMR